jgi:hypothetical protein
MVLFDRLIGLLFPRSRYGKPGVTRRGEQVRSRAEQRLAAYFDAIGLRYEYERELASGFWIFKRKVSCPDFYLPDHDVYVEYWGMVEVPDAGDREQYVRSMRYKLARYQELGVRCVSLYPDDLDHLDAAFRKRFREVTGMDLPGR